MHRTLIDEYGFAYTVEDTPCCYENRRDSTGKRLGPKPITERMLSYDAKQMRPREPRTDLSGHVLAE